MATRWHPQALFPSQTLDLLRVEVMAPPTQDGVGSAIAPAGVVTGEVPQLSTKIGVGSECLGRWHWLERCCRAIGRARRCERPSRCWSMWAARRRCDGLTISRDDLPKCEVLKLFVGHQALELRVLLLELLQALGVVSLHTPYWLVPPPVIGGLCHLEMAGDRRHVGPLVQHPVGFLELADDLLGVCLRLAIVNILPSPRILSNGLNSRVDRSPGCRQPALRTSQISPTAQIRPLAWRLQIHHKYGSQASSGIVPRMLAALLSARDGNTRLDPRSRKLRRAVAPGMPIQDPTAYSPRVMRLTSESPTITETRRDMQRNLEMFMFSVKAPIDNLTDNQP